MHHVLKQHPYRIIAHSIKDWTERNHHRTIQTIGLSASLTYAFGQKEVESALRSLCYDLSATKMISPTQDELISGGYVPSDDKIETMERPWQVPNGVVQENQRKPHLVHDTFMQRIRGNATTPFALMVYKVVRAIEDEVISKCSCFESPLENKKLNSWEEYAHRLSNDAVIGSSIQVVCQFLEVWYVALRMIVQSCIKNDSSEFLVYLDFLAYFMPFLLSEIVGGLRHSSRWGFVSFFSFQILVILPLLSILTLALHPL